MTVEADDIEWTPMADGGAVQQAYVNGHRVRLKYGPDGSFRGWDVGDVLVSGWMAHEKLGRRLALMVANALPAPEPPPELPEDF